MKNREIKFRIWNGTKMEHNIMVGFLGTFYVQGMDEKDAACMSSMNTKYYDNIIPMQFTGLKDCKGKEIYEGDICVITESSGKTHTGRRGYVYEDNDGGGWNLMNSKGKKEIIFPINIYCKKKSGQNIEVIGNIHENVGLLAVAPFNTK